MDAFESQASMTFNHPMDAYESPVTMTFNIPNFPNVLYNNMALFVLTLHVFEPLI